MTVYCLRGAAPIGLYGTIFCCEQYNMLFLAVSYDFFCVGVLLTKEKAYILSLLRRCVNPPRPNKKKLCSHLLLLVILHHSRIHFGIYSSIPLFSAPKKRVLYGSATPLHTYDMVPYCYLQIPSGERSDENKKSLFGASSHTSVRQIIQLYVLHTQKKTTKNTLNIAFFWENVQLLCTDVFFPSWKYDISRIYKTTWQCLGFVLPCVQPGMQTGRVEYVNLEEPQVTQPNPD